MGKNKWAQFTEMSFVTLYKMTIGLCVIKMRSVTSGLILVT